MVKLEGLLHCVLYLQLIIDGYVESFFAFTNDITLNVILIYRVRDYMLLAVTSQSVKNWNEY